MGRCTKDHLCSLKYNKGLSVDKVRVINNVYIQEIYGLKNLRISCAISQKRLFRVCFNEFFSIGVHLDKFPCQRGHVSIKYVCPLMMRSC